MRLCFVSLVALLTAARPSLAQYVADSLPLGAVVQIHGVTATTSGDRSYYLRVVIVGGDARHLIVSNAAGVHVDTLPFLAMSRLDLRDGQVSRRRLITTATLTGAGLGAAAYLGALALQNADGGSEWKNAQRYTLRSIPLLAGIGFTIGAVSSTERWISVRIPGGFSLPRR